MRIAAIAISLLLGGQVSAHATCGTRGGPGYRGPDGQCVGWASIGKICGSPPTTRCAPEMTRTGANKAAEFGDEIQKLRGRAVPGPDAPSPLPK